MNRAPGGGASAAPPRLYLITDRSATGGRPLAEVVAAALEGARRAGAPPETVAVQLRERDLPARQLVDLGRELRAITGAGRARLYINDRVDVALAVGADGVHLRAASLGPADVRGIDPSLEIAISAHHPEEVAAAAGRVAFAVFGPIKDTPSKRPYGPPLGWDRLAEAARLGTPVVAIGGLTAADVPVAVRQGAAGVACIRAILSAADPNAAAYAFCQELTVPTQNPPSRPPEQT